MRGRDFLDVARYLTGLENEASTRTRIGRLYYAAYLEVRSWCEVHLAYSRTQSAREHGEVARLVSALDKDLADDLAFLRGFRNTADYDIDLSPETISLQLEDAQLLAESVFARLDELKAPEPES